MIKKLLSSVFTKLLFIVVCSAVLLNIILFGIFTHYVENSETSLNRHRVIYIQFLRDEIGYPPDVRKAEALSERTGITVIYSSPEESWATGRTEGRFPEDKLHYRTIDENLTLGTLHGYQTAEITEGDSSIKFKFWPLTGEMERLSMYGWFMIGAVSLLMGAVYMLIRQILKPINYLSAAIAEVKKENYDYKINRCGSDELAHLCNMFDSLTSEISRSIKYKNKLLTGISHELRTPLTSLRIAAEMVKDEFLRKDMTDDIKQMDTLINYLMEGARIKHGALKKKHTDINKLTGEICAPYEEKTGRVVFVPHPYPIELNIDAKAIEHAVRNLIDNALKYSEESSEPVTVESGIVNGFTFIKVTDKGIGIPADELKFITEPFYRTDISRSKKTGGYGIGLDICKQIAEAHGGKLEIKSVLHKETEACLYFPVEQ
ncbi:HAMP domain-containing histidine kinase [Geovibrio thiophilus]|uniref:histidine kinase n=1 Tax=Geovibrio thiophilus TaxID=139438 RepID=A0A410JX07_9BACT|nr:HAMP domain-containing sensor histidine kinase [Geovibrio thiophilus]QAR32737.1 HAMP domain-containing histidine kinase [Geovibrio thiophilus]